MANTIFYSWQSDLPNKTNRTFIEDALNKAIDELHRDVALLPALRETELRLDRDTRGVPGMPPIAETIFGKISTATAFVPDLTFVGSTKEGRLLPNPNVLIEYGWALRALSHGRIVAVMNSAYGAPDETNLPFDMRHLRRPLTFYLREDADSQTRSSVRTSLIGDLKAALAAILDIPSPSPPPPTPSPQHQEVASTTNPSNFLAPGEILIRDPASRFSAERIYGFPSSQAMFLRLIPTQKTEQLTSATAALDLARAGRLTAMGETAGYARNKWGAVAYTDDTEARQILMFTQLFLNRELWGVDAHLLDKRRLMERHERRSGFFPGGAVERTFVTAFVSFLRFAREQLELPMPLKWRAGVCGVEGYQMTAPDGMHFGGFEQLAGNAISENIVYDGVVENYVDDPTVILQPFFERIWDDCGLKYPKPKEKAAR